MIKLRKNQIRLVAVILSFILLITACNNVSKPEQVQESFNMFTTELFVQEVQADTLSLNYSLAQPQRFGIELKETTLGKFSIDEMYQGLADTENHLKKLKTFDYSLLTKEQQLTYDILKKHLELKLESGYYLHYNECLGPTTGIQAQLPILLAEYNFYTREDIDRYIELLSCVYAYFESIADFQREKSAKGLFMSDPVADSIIEQCQSFISNPESNFLIDYFDEKITAFDGLSEKDIKNYQSANKKAILENVIPAYELLIGVLNELRGTGTSNRGLSQYPDGKAFYRNLAQYKTGSNKSMDEMVDMLEEGMGDCIINLSTLTLTDATLIDKYLSFESFPLTDPEEILMDLQDQIEEDFPAPIPVSCNIKYVHESLEDHLSPAMYLVPAIDNYQMNNIYINGDDMETLAYIYTTVAHEGYPGHLYQNVYFRDKQPAPIRNLMNFIGYDEGWATYVEMYSYGLAGIDSNLADFLKYNNLVILFLYARTDIGIHYEGWSKEQAITYITTFINNDEVAETIYQTLLEEPAIYLPYAVGYLEVMNLRTKAENALEDQFVVKNFHQFLLDIGPAQFDVIEKHLEQWINQELGAGSNFG